ncbi:hypothetical protein SLA2020_286830 [Shorea laevis]
MFSSLFFIKIVFFQAFVARIPPFELFADLDNPVNDILRLTLPFIEDVLPHLRVSVVHLLVCSGCCRVPPPLLPSVIYIMGKANPNYSSGDFDGTP